MVTVAAFVTTVVPGTTVKPHNLAIRHPRAATRLFRVPDFHYYALANGIAEVCLQLHALAYNLGNFLRALALPDGVSHWSLTTLRA